MVFAAAFFLIYPTPSAGQPSRPGVSFPPWLVQWKADPEHPVFRAGAPDEWDSRIRERGWITWYAGHYHLFYTGYNEQRSPRRMLGSALSADGVNWVRQRDNPIHQSSWVEDVTILPLKRSFVMFAEGENDIAHRLVSTDLRRWQERGPLTIRTEVGVPIPEGPRGTPFVFREGQTWYLFYERSDNGVWLAASADGESWRNVRDRPVLTPGPEPYDRGGLAVNQVIKYQGAYYALYHGTAVRPGHPWNTCIAASRDLLQWEKYKGNPIISGNRSSGIIIESAEGRHLYTMHPEVWRFSSATSDTHSPTIREQ